MGWDERLFGWAWSLVGRGRRRAAAARTARGVALGPEVARLELLAAAISGRRLTVFPVDADGGLRGDTLIVPATMAVLPDRDDNAALALARVGLGAIVARRAEATGPGATPAEVAARSFAELAAAIAIADDELPGLAALVARLRPGLLAIRPALADLTGADRALEVQARRLLGQPEAELAGADPAAAIAGGRVAVVPLLGWIGAPDVDPASIEPPRAGESAPRGGRERRGKARDRVVRRTLDERPLGENPMVHSFEKVHTLEKYQGGRKQVDGADELDAHGEALDELDLDEVVRSTTATSAVYRADVLGLDAVGELADDAAPESGAIAYDEWDQRARRYRPAWCQVRVEARPIRAAAEVTAAFVQQARALYRRERTELAAQLARLDAQPMRLCRQSDGPDVDIDAVVDRHGALRAGTTGADKLYVATRRRPPDLAVVLLLDRSLSSDAWVANRRVLDVGTGALVALGEALDHVAAATAILAFHSHTRRDCRIAMLKDFAAPWPVAHARLAALEPAGYTRIGPALRHATALLADAPARRKLLVLLSDGKPTDYDRYEGAYGLGDVRQAVAEAAQQGIHAFALALDVRARGHLPRMFGAGGFAVVSRPADLVVALGRLYRERLAR